MPERDTAVAVALPEVFRLSSTQSAFWADEMLSGRCNVLSFDVSFDRPIDLDRLDGALAAVLVRHPLLRARFASEPAGPMMSIESRPETILTRLSASVGSLEEWCARPPGLYSWPLVRAAVVLGDSRTQLRVVVHHAIFDGESKDVFLRDLARAYRGERLVPVARSLRHAGFWRAFLERTERAAPADPREGELIEAAQIVRSTPQPGARGRESLSFVVDANLLAVVGATARGLNVSKFAVHLAAWHAALVRIGLLDVDIVTPVAVSTREADDAAEIGPFVNETAVRSTAPRTASFRSLVLDIAEGLRCVRTNRHRRAPAVGGSRGFQPELTVSYRRDTLGDFVWPDAAATPMLVPPLMTPRPGVTVRMLHHGATTSGVIDVGSPAMWRWSAQRLERCWRALLRAGAQQPDMPIAELPLEEPQ